MGGSRYRRDMSAGFDPASLHDPVAMQTSWTTLGGGASFRTHRLVLDGPSRVHFRPTLGALAIYGVFLAVGLALLGAAYTSYAARGHSPSGPLVVGLVFFGAGAAMVWAGARPIVFDRPRARYWKAWVAPRNGAGVPLERVHAVQQLRRRSSARGKRYFSHELNLVLADGGRLHVVSHGDLVEITADGIVLAEFLGVPLWTAA